MEDLIFFIFYNLFVFVFCFFFLFMFLFLLPSRVDLWTPEEYLTNCVACLLISLFDWKNKNLILSFGRVTCSPCNRGGYRTLRQSPVSQSVLEDERAGASGVFQMALTTRIHSVTHVPPFIFGIGLFNAVNPTKFSFPFLVRDERSFRKFSLSGSRPFRKRFGLDHITLIRSPV